MADGSEQGVDVGGERDRAGDQRDDAAAVRDESAGRTDAEQDRLAGALDRRHAEIDRATALVDRGASADERVLADRDAAAKDRAFASVDELTGVYRRGAGFADALTAKLRSYDLIIRYGGDEFVCALTGLALPEARERLALVNDTLAQNPEPASVTIGFAQLGPHESPEALVARADAELYQERQRDRGGHAR